MTKLRQLLQRLQEKSVVHGDTNDHYIVPADIVRELVKCRVTSVAASPSFCRHDNATFMNPCPRCQPDGVREKL